jgi:Domain of unknown function (DUF4157)
MNWVWFIQSWAAGQADSGQSDSSARPPARRAARASRKVHAPPALSLGGGEAAKESEAERGGGRADAPRPGGPVPAAVRETLRAQGQPLDTKTRAALEPRFGRSFSDVRVHTDSRAAESARAVDASAYTVGPHIVFAPGQYAPHTPHGRSLLAHELTHVVQQGASPLEGAEGAIRHAPEAPESEADAAAGAASEGRAVRAVSRLPRPALQRQKASAPKPAAPKPKAPKPAAALSLLGPKVTVEQKFSGKTLPAVDLGGYVATSSISLVAGATFTPAAGPVKGAMLNDKEIAVELGRLAASFTLAKKARGPRAVTFTSSQPGYSEINSDSFAALSANTFVYSGALGPPASISKSFVMSGELRVQLQLTLTPKPPPAPQEQPKAPATQRAPAPPPRPPVLDGVMAVLEVVLVALLLLI